MSDIVDKIIKKRILLDSKLAIVSFTFDDAPLSSFTNGGRILEQNGYLGTFYISSKLIGKSTKIGKMADLKTIIEFHNRGHEIANHTDSHFDCTNISPFRMARSIWDNRKKLNGVMSKNFSYPSGLADTISRCVARICTSSARGIGFNINQGMIDLKYLNAVRIYNNIGLEKCMKLVSECNINGGWLIFYTHDVCDEPSDYGCKTSQFDKLVKLVHSNKMIVLNIKDALKIINKSQLKM